MSPADKKGQGMDSQPRHVAIGRDDLEGSRGSIYARPGWTDRFFMMLILAAGVIGLARLSFHVARQDPELEPASSSGAGIIVRSETIRLWLSRTLTELAQGQSQSRAIRSHEELRRLLELEGREDLWYALTARGHQVDGHFADITMIRRPYDDAPHFPELREILATVAGGQSRHPEADFSRASVHIIAEELLECEPREVMAGLLGLPDPATVHGRSP